MPRSSFVRALAGGAAALLVAAAIAVFVYGAPAPVQQAAAIGGPFTLEDGAGKTVTDADFRGKYMLVYFGYTFCPDVCPTTLNDVAQAMDKLGARADRVRPVFITVDPGRDTPEVVRQYTAAFSPRLVGLTGSQAQITAVEREYRVYAAQHRTGPGPADYTMDHSSVLYLMDAKGSSPGSSDPTLARTGSPPTSRNTCRDEEIRDAPIHAVRHSCPRGRARPGPTQRDGDAGLVARHDAGSHHRGGLRDSHGG